MTKSSYKIIVGASVLCLVTACSKQDTAVDEPAVLTVMPGNSYLSSASKPSKNELEISDNLLEVVKTLSVDIGERNIENMDNFNKASDFIKSKLKSYGYTPQSNSYNYEKQKVENIFTIK